MAGVDRLERLSAMSQRRKDRAARHVADCLAAHERALEQHRQASGALDAALQGEREAIDHMRAAPGEEQRRIWMAHQITAREGARTTLDYASSDMQDALDDLAIARRVFLRCSVKHDRIGEMIRKVRASVTRLRDDRNSEEHAEAAHLRARLAPTVMTGGFIP